MFFNFAHPNNRDFIYPFNFTEAVENSIEILESIADSSVSDKEYLYLRRNINKINLEIEEFAQKCKQRFNPKTEPEAVCSQACLLIEAIQTINNQAWERISVCVDTHEDQTIGNLDRTKKVSFCL
ncbi:MAG: hypothetical protein P1U39_02150 [Legionellaceae bacterium]|nr:hypothetical protein [Legionellaceae bacterium]